MPVIVVDRLYPTATSSAVILTYDNLTPGHDEAVADASELTASLIHALKNCALWLHD